MAVDAVIVISAGTEWRFVCEYYPQAEIHPSPFGGWFEIDLANRHVIFLQGGWGKISAAASAQYALDHWSPALMVNLGTCGGFAGMIDRSEVLLVDRTLVYDIIEQMVDPQIAIQHYATDLDLSWLQGPYPQAVRRSLLVSADRDICVSDIPMLQDQYSAVAADWESGAIAWVCARNGARCLILRGVSDLVGETGGEAYGALEIFQAGTQRVMRPMLAALPAWLACCNQ
jgi:adenosylhomocysteine nucleosidase